ncbi:hypothetical protein GW17_00032089, partial [Ensete ventricosum]
METEVLSRSVRGRLTGTRFLSRLRGPRLPEKPNGRLFQVGRRITSLVLWFDPCIRYSKWEIVSFILLDKQSSTDTSGQFVAAGWLCKRKRNKKRPAEGGNKELKAKEMDERVWCLVAFETKKLQLLPTGT